MAFKEPILPIGRSSSDPTALADRDSAQSSIRANLTWVLFFVLVLIGLGLVLFLVPGVKPPEEKLGTWVERFGSLVGVLSLFIESKLKKVESILLKASAYLPPPLFTSLKKSYSKIPFFEKLSFSFAILGAVTWAYGSVIIFLMCSLLSACCKI